MYDFAESRAKGGETVGEALRRELEVHCGLRPRKHRSLVAERRRSIYRVPILSILLQGNGEAYVADIKDKLLSGLNSRLTEEERTGTKSARPAWWYDAVETGQHVLDLEESAAAEERRRRQQLGV